MKKVTLLFRSGSTINFNCEELEVSKNKVTGELIGYSAKGVSGSAPKYARIEDIDCICVEDIEESDKLVYPEGIED